MVHTCPATSFAFLGSLGAFLGAAGLVVAGWVEGQVAEEVALAGDDPHVSVVGEHVDASAGQESAEADVVEPAVVAQGDRAGAAFASVVG